ncbi:hypothetical protein [Filimonas effusa]|uniref:T9SS C-terminal target domain-containing protein n=1 Tax=Filimonas effusa TaxID=2508721 RepID=A0A4V1MA05_9BACT|nr:hypothetical protein [Filimonas effusa]RXK83494.1 hypothetical protein ESB13_15490 [Filimonas effusa]
MKRKLLQAALIATTITAVSCSKNDDNGPSVGVENGLSGDTLRGAIEVNITLEEGKTYFLDGGTFFRSGATLTIKPGAVIKALPLAQTSKKKYHSFLVIERGARILAEGTASKPIVFTSAQPVGSRKAGDWGGVMILGRAPVNTTFGGAVGRQMEGFSDADGEELGTHIVGGGADANDNSGILKYVRIEFAGVALSNKSNSELNSLTMIGVGKGTTIDYVQCSHGGDDAFEWFGGTVNAKHLVAYRGLDDDFDTDNGFNGAVQFALAIRDKEISDYLLPGDSNGFESDNDPTGTYSAPLTAPVFSNVTIIGPSAINGGASIPSNAVFNRAAFIRRNSRNSIFNSALVGFPAGVYIDGNGSATATNTDSLEIKNTFVGAIGGIFKGAAGAKIATNATNGFDAKTWFMKSGNNNDTTYNSIADFKFVNMSGDLKTIDARPQATSPLLGKASFSSSTKIQNSYFTQVTYVGAFSGPSDNWMQGWTNFDPLTTVY